MSNVYYSPEKFGLTEVAEVEAMGGYEYDKFVIWKDRAGNYLWSFDSGCSCPTPFSSDHLGNLPVGSLRDALTDLDAWIGDDKYDHGYGYGNRKRAADTDRIRALRETA